MASTFRRPPKPLPILRDCPVCQGKPYTLADLKAHNLAAAEYGERVYRGPRHA